MNLYRRTEDILEIQEGPSTAVRGKAACAEDLMVESKLPFTTLLSNLSTNYATCCFIVNFIRVVIIQEAYRINLYSSTPFVTGPDAPARPCTANGYHNVTSLNLKGATEFCDPEHPESSGFREITARCKSSELLEFIRDCGAEQTSGLTNIAHVVEFNSWL